MDLSGRSRAHKQRNALRAHPTHHYLHFEGSPVAGIHVNRANLKPVEESDSSISSYCLIGQRNEGCNRFAGRARRKRASIYLIVSRLNLRRYFSEEGKGDPGPLGIAPMGSNHEGDDSAIWVDCLDREEKVLASLALQVINREGDIGRAIERSSERVVIALDISAICQWNHSAWGNCDGV